MKRSAGFTLLETVYCIAIIAIVTAILAPAFRAAKHSAYVTASISNLHQMHVALMLYQAAQGTSAQYGSLASMGLPNAYQIDSLNLPAAVLKSPCGRNPSWCPVPIDIEYEYYPSTSLTPFDDFNSKYQENSTMFVDMNCAEHGEPLHSDYLIHRGLGVLLSGTLLNLNKKGDYRFQRWWSEPVTN